MPQSQSSFVCQLRQPVRFTCVGGSVFSLFLICTAPVPRSLSLSKPKSPGHAVGERTWLTGATHKVNAGSRNLSGVGPRVSNAHARNRFRCGVCKRHRQLRSVSLGALSLLPLCQSRLRQFMHYRRLNRPLPPAQMHTARLGTGQLAILPAAQCFSTSLTAPSSGQPRSTGSAAHVRR